jgi:hypothetical protein
VASTITSRIAAGAMEISLNNKTEIIAVVLLGIGGAIWPPIWILGAALALASKKWDIADKFFGVTLPVLLVIVGTVAIVVLGGQHPSLESYAFEAWVGAGRLSRIAAVAGALYLTVALRPGRRRPKPPPWKVPRRIG